jgi:phage gp37-like protein
MEKFDLRKNLIERRNADIDPSWAKHYLLYNTYKYQRKVRDGHVNELAEKMIDGRFRFGDLAFAVYKGQDIMMNGQHQSHAIIKSGQTIPCVIERYRCTNEIDLSDMFKQFENLPRSTNDYVDAEAGALNLNWPLYIPRLVIAAATIEYTINNSSISNQLKGNINPATSTTKQAKNPLFKENRVNFLRNYIKEGNFVNKIFTHINGQTVIDKKTTIHLRRAPVVYVMFLTFRKNEKDATVFWKNVRDGEVLTSDMPEWKLREFLKNVNSMTTHLSRRVVKDHEYICKCIAAWNAFRKQTTTRLAYSIDKEIPIVI